MKIFYLLEYPIEINGGAQLSTLNTAIELQKEYGVESYIVTPDYPDDVKNNTFLDANVLKLKSCYYRSPSPISNPYQFFQVKKELEKLILEYNPDIVHSQMPLSFIYNAILNKKVIKVHTDRGLYTGYSKKSKFLYSLLIRHIDKLITTTNYNFNLWPLDKQKKACIYNTISKDFNKYELIKYNYVKEQYKISKDYIVIGFAGRYTEYKNWPFILKLIKKLVKENIKFHLLIAFAINLNEPEEVSELKEYEHYINKLKNNNITILYNLDQKEMSDFYYPVDVFVIPSVFESFGKVAIEAMARKCCVISSDVGGLPEVIGNKRFVLELDVSYFYSLIVEMVKNPKDLLEAQESFFNRYNKLFSPQHNTQKHFQLYRNLLEEKNEN